MFNIGDILSKISISEFVFSVKKQTIFPYYHLIGENNIKHIKHLYNYKTEDQFNADLDFLLKHYTPLHPKDLLQNNIPPNSFLLSFDDGLKEIYTKIYPILKKRKLSAIFFLNPNFVDNKDALYRHFLSLSFEKLKENGLKKNELEDISSILEFEYNTVDEFKKAFLKMQYIDRDKINLVLKYLKINKKEFLEENNFYASSTEIQEMIDDGFYFGGHTMSHPPLRQLNIDEQEAEIVESIDWVKKKFNLNYSLFAFPFSDASMSKQLFDKVMAKHKDVLFFGNVGIIDDIYPNIIQRFSLEDPKIFAGKKIVYENFLKTYRKFRGKNKVERK